MTTQVKITLLLVLTCILSRVLCLSKQIKETHKKPQHAKSHHLSNISKKQQVVVPMNNFASNYGQGNGISPFLRLEGSDEGPVKEPTTVFLNSGGQTNPYSPPISQMEDNEEHLQTPFVDNSYNTDPSLFSNEMDNTYSNNFNDNVNQNENYNDDDHENDNVAFSNNNVQPSLYAEPTNLDYDGQASENEENAPEETASNLNNYGSDTLLTGSEQGIPALSRLAIAKLREINNLYALGQKHSILGSPYYMPFVKHVLPKKAHKVQVKLVTKTDSKSDSEDAKIPKETKSQNKTSVRPTDQMHAEVKDEAKDKQEYKKIVKSAELAANLAEAARTLTKLIKKLTSQAATATLKREEEQATENASSKGDVSASEGWSEWSKWSPCSSGCGGGLTYSRRNCSNPSPQNGDHKCSGKRIQVRLCNVGQCKHSTTSKVDLARSLGEMAEARSSISRPIKKSTNKVISRRPSKP